MADIHQMSNHGRGMILVGMTVMFAAGISMVALAH